MLFLLSCSRFAKVRLFSFCYATLQSDLTALNRRNLILKCHNATQFHRRKIHCTCCLLKKRTQSSRKPLTLKPVSKKTSVDVYDSISTRELANAMNIELNSIFEAIKIIDNPLMKSISPETELKTSQLAYIMGYFQMKPSYRNRKPLNVSDEDLDAYPQPYSDPEKFEIRPAVVAIMGHVDHGKTTLLDALRKSQIVQHEFGGITQHIGAFSVKLPDCDSRITFLDTPGHSAFSSMRQRGALATDLVVLVVAADDGVKEQTIESINYARKAKVPMLIAINKCDLSNADPDAAKRGLLAHNVIVEDFQGDVQCVEISALNGTNLIALQEAIIAQAEVMNLKADRNAPVEGLVLEWTSSPTIGKQCTILITKGTLKPGACLVVGVCWGKVRSILDDQGRRLNAAGPSTPVVVGGWRTGIASLGDQVLQVENENRAQIVINYRSMHLNELKADQAWFDTENERKVERDEHSRNRSNRFAKGIRRKLRIKNYHMPSTSYKNLKNDEKPSISLILKGDVDGSVEAIMQVIDTYDSDQCKLNIIEFGVGIPTENEVEIAKEFNAIIYCFNLPNLPRKISELIDENGISLRHFNVIYHLIDDLKSCLVEQMPIVFEDKIQGEGRVIKEFLISDGARKRQPIAGCSVEYGFFERHGLVRFRRGETDYFDGKMVMMKKENEVINKANVDQEIGVQLEDKNIRFEIGDVVQCYKKIEVENVLNWTPRGF